MGNINLDSEARRESARQSDGRFGTQEHAEPMHGLDTFGSEVPGVVEVCDYGGETHPITPGVIDDNARYVYKHGQCYALAKAFADRGYRVGAVLVPDECNESPVGWEVVRASYEDFNDDIGLVAELGAHFFAYSDDGDILDIEGAQDPVVYQEMMKDAHDGAILIDVTPEQLDEVMDYVTECEATFDLDVETAATFVDPIIRMAREEVADV